MTVCSVLGCTSGSEQGHKFFQVPSHKRAAERHIWLVRIGRNDSEPDSSKFRVCMNHFTPSDVLTNKSNGRRFLKKNAIPLSIDDTNIEYVDETIPASNEIDDETEMFVDQHEESSISNDQTESNQQTLEVYLEEPMTTAKIPEPPESTPTPLLPFSSIVKLELSPGEIAYESFVNASTKVLSKTTPLSDSTSGVPQLSVCTNQSCNVLDITTALRQKPQFPKKKSYTITNPIMTPLWQEPPNENNECTKKLYYVHGSDVIDNEPSYDENGQQIVYKIVPNTHAHVVKYVVREGERPIGVEDIIEIVDKSGNQENIIRLKENTAELLNLNTKKPVKDESYNDNDDDINANEPEEEYQNTIPLAKVPLSKIISNSQGTSNGTSKISSNGMKEIEESKLLAMEKRIEFLERRREWSDQEMARMNGEINQLKTQVAKLLAMITEE